MRASRWTRPHPSLVGSLGVFLASVAATAVMCRSMRGGMAMQGGWTMSMTWIRMPGQSWLAAAAMFLGMWTVMMVAMMMPSLMPVLSRASKSGSPYGKNTHAARL
jgi:predicted metal-binding membrane protein